MFGSTELLLTDNKPDDDRNDAGCFIKTDYGVKGFSNVIRQELLPHDTCGPEKTQDLLRSLLAALLADAKEE